MKTINQSYTPAQRKQIAQDLRRVDLAAEWEERLPVKTKDYVSKVLHPNWSFIGWALANGRNIAEHPQGREGYCREALNRLAEELDEPESEK